MGLCFLVMLAARKDAPDGERKTQAVPVPSMGGLGIAAALLLPLALTLPTGGLSFGNPFFVFAQLAAAPLLIGFLDDAFDLDAKLKLFALAVAALLAALAGYHAGFSEDAPFILAAVVIAGSALWIFVMMNAANFMDGANGIMAGSIAIMLAGLYALGLWTAVLLPAIAGFLVFNLRGKLYAGDTGALFLGFVFAAAALEGVRIGLFPVWTPATLALPFLVDVFMTLIWRARRGAPLMQAHTDHAYQLLRKAGWGHIAVSAVCWAASGVCAVCAGAAVQFGGAWPIAMFGALLLFGISIWVWQRRMLAAFA